MSIVYGQPATVEYTNHKGIREVRIITPLNIFWGKNEYHPDWQWLMEVFCHKHNATRTFAVKDIHKWSL